MILDSLTIGNNNINNKTDLYILAPFLKKSINQMCCGYTGNDV